MQVQRRRAVDGLVDLPHATRVARLGEIDDRINFVPCSVNGLHSSMLVRTTLREFERACASGSLESSERLNTNNLCVKTIRTEIRHRTSYAQARNVSLCLCLCKHHRNEYDIRAEYILERLTRNLA